MKHDVVIMGPGGEQFLARDITPEQLFEMYASAAIRLERVEVIVAQTAMLLLHHLGEAPPPSECDISDVIADLHASLSEIHDVMAAAQQLRGHMDFLNSKE